MESAVAAPPLTCQVSVAGWPEVIVLGEAVKLSVNGTSTVRFLVELPPGPEAVMVKTVVVFTGTTEDPEVGKELVPSLSGTGGAIVTDVALVVAQLIVVVRPPFTAGGFAVNDVICGCTGRATCTLVFCGGLLPPGPVATAAYVVVCVGASVTLPEA
jgi:hypothetical protein